MLTPGQLEARRGRIGGSDLARIVTGKFGGLAAVVAEKLGEGSDQASELTALGDALERPLLAWVEERLPPGASIVPGIVFADLLSPITVLCDGVVRSETADPSPIECKGVTSRGIGEWSDGDEVSEYAHVQVQAQIAAMGADHGHIAAWFVPEPGRKLFRVERDDQLIAELRRIATTVMQAFVLPKRLPDPTMDSAALVCRALSKRDRDNAITVAVEGEDAENVREYLARRELHLRDEKVLDLLKARILQRAGDAGILDVEGKQIKLKRVDVTESHCTCGRVLRAGTSYVKIDEVKNDGRIGKEVAKHRLGGD